MGRYTDLLFARPSFIGGMASVADLAGTLVEYNRSPTPAKADYNALRSDWRQVGQDMEVAIGQVAAEDKLPVKRDKHRSAR